MKTFAAASIVLALVTPAHAQNSLPFIDPLFTDNMVLQRGAADSVWGWTTPGQSITVQFDGKTATATADANGKWITSIGPFKAGGPYTLTISGPQTMTINNVMVGDVWICSGQSNMEFGIGNGINAAQEIAAANYPNIRIYTVAKATATAPQMLTNGQWQPVTPTTITQEGTWNGFSAVGYFFGRGLYQSLNVPIGLLLTSWGGTPAEAWTSQDALATHLPEFQDSLTRLVTNSGQTQAQLEASWYAKNDPGTNGNWQDPAADMSDWKAITLPCYYQEAGIPELSGINGIVWFRRTFDLPAGDAGRDEVLHELVDDNDTTWVNGTVVGATDGFQAQRAYTIPAALLKPTGNVVVIRDVDTGGLGGVYGDPASLEVTVDQGTDIPLAGGWLYRLSNLFSQTTPFPVVVDGNPDYPTELFNGMINPLIPFGVKGAIWYQGEANAGKAMQYRTLLPTMITDWRTRWNEGNFPFLIVQLAGWQPGGSLWPELRQAQWLTAQNLPNTGIVTAVDIGDQTDIHPKNKQEVGRRLALVAEATVYGKKVADSGPVYKSASVQGSSVRVYFTQVNGGLVAQSGTSLSGFEVAGTDGQFVPADAVIDGDTVVVSAASVPDPVAVQYDWSGYPDGNLYNKAGLPTFPFKSDEK